MIPKLTSLAKNSPNNTGVFHVSVIHLAAESISTIQVSKA